MARKKNGFTLVELLAVIVVLALIMIIVIPSILDVMNRARKESFYLYAESIESKAVAKFTTDLDDETILDTCMVYDIEKDLGLENTGEYEGWIKLNRVAVTDTSKKSATINLTSSSVMAYVKYCVDKGTTCTPTKSFAIEDNQKTAKITQVLREGQVLCALYQYKDGTSIKTSGTQCVTFANAQSVVSDYTYDIDLTMKTNNYGVQNFSFNYEDRSKTNNKKNSLKDDFYKAMDAYEEQAKTKTANREVNPYAIASPVCKSGDPVTLKGTTTTKKAAVSEKTTTTKVKTCPTLTDKEKVFKINLNANGGEIKSGVYEIEQCADCGVTTNLPTPERYGYIFDGWYYDKAFSKKVTGDLSTNVAKSEKLDDSKKCTVGYNDVYLYAKWSIDPSKTTTKVTTEVSERESSTKEQQSTDVASTTTTEKGSEGEKSTTTTERGEIEETTTTTAERETTEATTTTWVRDKTDITILLDSLNVSGYTIEFSPVRFDYEVVVPYSQTSIGVSAIPHSPETSVVSITGNNDLGVGDNNVLVRVTNNETSKENVYRVLVARLNERGQRITTKPKQPTEDWDPESGIPDPTLDESNAQLEYLIVSGYTLDFDPNVYNYDIVVDNQDDLLITYRTAVKGAFVNIAGNENIKDGSQVEVYVRSINGYYEKSYMINVKYNRQEDPKTKYIRNLMIVLLVILLSTLLIVYSNKKHGRSIIKKKTDDSNKDNGNNQDTSPSNPEN